MMGRGRSGRGWASWPVASCSDIPFLLHVGVCSCTLGSYVECGIGRGPCKLLPQGK